MARLLFIGFGYVASHIAELLPTINVQYQATKRNSKGDYIEFSYPNKIANIDFTNYDYLISSIPPSKQGDPCYLAYKEKLNKLDSPITVIYFSASSVYGNYNGEYVDENSPLLAQEGSRGYLRLIAEQQWQELADNNQNLNLIILRLPAIYGPYRSSLTYIKQKNELIYEPRKLFNRIHVKDIAQIVVELIKQQKSSAIYNLCDNYLSPLHETYQYAAKLLNLPMPKLVALNESNASDAMKEFFLNHRILKNNKIINDLSYNLVYPDYIQGFNNLYNKPQY